MIWGGYGMSRKTVAAIVTVVAMLLNILLPVSASVKAADRGDIYSEGFSFAPHDVYEDLSSDEVIYTDEFFEFPASLCNPHLASASMAFAAAGIASQNALNDGIKENQPKNAESFLTSLGFDSFAANDDFVNWPDKDGLSFGVCAAAKQTVINGKPYTLIAFTPRNANYAAEWAGNVRIGDGSESDESEGFLFAKNRYIEFFKSYVAGYFAGHPQAAGNVKLWAVGYSRGAGAVNIATPYICDHIGELLPAGVSLGREDMYVYTFGTPRAAYGGTGDENSAALASYTFVHNFVSDYDMTPMVAFEDYGFARYGVDHRINVGYDPATARDNPENKASMLSFLAATNPVLYDKYVADGSTYDPDKYIPFKFKGDGTFAVEPDFENVQGLPTSLEGFFKERFSAVAALPGSRAAYAAEYQRPISTLVKYFKGDYSDRPGRLLNNLMMHENIKSVGMLTLAYYVCREGMELWNEADETERASVREELKGMLSIGLRLAESELEEWVGDAGFPAEDINRLKAVLEEGIDTWEFSGDEMLNRLGSVAGYTFMKAVEETAAISGYTEEEISEIVGDSYANGKALLDVFIALIFDRQEKSLDLISINPDTGEFGFNWNCSQMCQLATFMGNASQLGSHSHANEVIRSWLKTQDTYYSDSYNYSAYRTLSMSIPAEGASVVIKNAAGESISFKADENGIERDAPTRPFELDIYTNLKDGVLSIILPFGSSFEVSVNVGAEWTVDSSVSEFMTDGTLSDRFVKGSRGESFTGLKLRSCDRLIYTLSDRTEAGIVDTAQYDVNLIEIESPQTGDDAPIDVRQVACIMLLSAIGLAVCAGIKRRNRYSSG